MVIKEIINQSKSSKEQSSFMINGQLTEDKVKISNGFNKFFVEIWPNLEKKCPPSNHSPMNWMKNRPPNSIFLTPTDADEIYKITINLKDSSSGWDGINLQNTKLALPYIMNPLIHIMNLSLH